MRSPGVEAVGRGCRIPASCGDEGAAPSRHSRLRREVHHLGRPQLPQAWHRRQLLRHGLLRCGAALLIDGGGYRVLDRNDKETVKVPGSAAQEPHLQDFFHCIKAATAPPRTWKTATRAPCSAGSATSPGISAAVKFARGCEAPLADTTDAGGRVIARVICGRTLRDSAPAPRLQSESLR